MLLAKIMMKIRTTVLLLGVVALCAVTIASPLGKPADSSSEESAESGEFMKELHEMCRNNSGSDAAFMALVDSAQSTMVCAVSTIDMDTLMVDIEALSNETRTTFFPRYCPQFRKLFTCVDKFANDARPCFEEDDYTIVKALVGVFPDAIELICKDDGDILFKYDEPKYIDCFEKVSDSFDECLTFLNGTDDWDLSQMNQEQCGQMTGFRQCLQDKMNICKAPDLIGVYDLFHNMMIRLTPCRNYVEVPKVIQNNAIDNNELNEV